MRFMVIRKADPDTEAGAMPSPQLFADMMQYHEEMVNAGILLAGEGLRPSSLGARVKFHEGRPRVIDGPFTETKELVAGFSIIEVESLQDALEWVKRWPQSDGHGEVELEIRQVVEAGDFGEAFSDDLRRLEDRLRGQSAQLSDGPQP